MKRAHSEVLSGDEVPNKKIKTSEPEVSESHTSLLYTPPSGRAPGPVTFQQPQQLVTFSYTPQHELEFTNSALRYYVDPPNGADLRYGYDRWIKRPEEKGRLDSLLRAVSRTRSKMKEGQPSAPDWLSTIGVVSWRGVMTKILTAPYEERDGWDLNVMLVNGTLYFEEHSSDARLVDRNNLPPNQRLQTYYGYSFESYCTSSERPTDGHKAGWGGDVDTNVQWCSVVKTKLADTRLVIGGEVDCVRDKHTGKTNTLVELKTSMNIRHAQDEARFEKKLLKFYFQSFLLGVPEIVVGFRSPQGRLGTIQSFKTVEIPRMVRGKPHAWDPTRCLDWANRFLTFLKDTITPCIDKEDSAATPVWRIKFNPGTGISASLLDKTGVDEVSAGEERVGFLPKWYLDELKDSKAVPLLHQASPNHVPKRDSIQPSQPTALPSGWQI
ncbi:Protein rai1 [Steccherinum ochraceum]|uniref:Decapping nuclease n=1 Tax=Steccherinum ochraceum TaxID=92696 RepID=A0A4R0RAR3_9APHY|nr:Protein rai1 [Steccherinum ochraceum]